MMNMDDSMAKSAKILKKPKLGYEDMEEYLKKARELYGYKEPACPEGEKMVFGVCRKVGDSNKGQKDFDTNSKSKSEEERESEAAAAGSDASNNKKWKGKDGKEYGWAIKNGKKVVVEWGSVAGKGKESKERKEEKEFSEAFVWEFATCRRPDGSLYGSPSGTCRKGVLVDGSAKEPKAKKKKLSDEDRKVVLRERMRERRRKAREAEAAAAAAEGKQTPAKETKKKRPETKEMAGRLEKLTSKSEARVRKASGKTLVPKTEEENRSNLKVRRNISQIELETEGADSLTDRLEGRPKPKESLMIGGVEFGSLAEEKFKEDFKIPRLQNKDEYKTSYEEWKAKEDGVPREDYSMWYEKMRVLKNLSECEGSPETIRDLAEASEKMARIRALSVYAYEEGDKELRRFAQEAWREADRKFNPRAIYHGEPSELPTPQGDPSIRGRADSPPLPPKLRYGGNQDEGLRNFLEEADVYVQVPPESMVKVLQDGRMKNRFERGADKGIGEGKRGYAGRRKDAETAVLGIPKGAKAQERPIYAYIQNDQVSRSGGYEIASFYGSVQVKLKPDVKSRSSFTVGDSLDDGLADGQVASPVLNPAPIQGNVRLRGAEEIGSVNTNLVGRRIGSYLEAQVFGGINVSEIDSVRVPASVLESNPEMKRLLEDKGIKIELINKPFVI